MINIVSCCCGETTQAISVWRTFAGVMTDGDERHSLLSPCWVERNHPEKPDSSKFDEGHPVCLMCGGYGLLKDVLRDGPAITCPDCKYDALGGEP